MEQQEQNIRNLPTSDLDLNMMITDSVWGRPEVSPELKEALAQSYEYKKEDGTIVIKSSSLWGLLSFYTRDIRLGNLSEWNGELQACRYDLELCGQLLYAGLVEPFLVALSMAITIIETSQSKGGFLRRAMNTLRTEQIHQQIEPPKKAFFGGKKTDTGGMN